LLLGIGARLASLVPGIHALFERGVVQVAVQPRPA
jgi:hypothetical protein